MMQVNLIYDASYLKGRKDCERKGCGRKNCKIKKSENWPNLHSLIPHFPVRNSNSHSFLPHFQLYIAY